MKRILILFLFLLFNLATPSAYLKVCYILASPEINEYDALIKAIVAVESKGDTWALNVKEQAVGAFQIRPCRIEHYNRLAGTNYKPWDCFDYDLSRKIFLFFAQGKSYQRAARDWNGKWELTEGYWRKIKKVLYN